MLKLDPPRKGNLKRPANHANHAKGKVDGGWTTWKSESQGGQIKITIMSKPQLIRGMGWVASQIRIFRFCLRNLYTRVFGKLGNGGGVKPKGWERMGKERNYWELLGKINLSKKLTGFSESLPL